MITSEYHLHGAKPQGLIPADPAQSFFFDIETTGFKASSSHVYLIGAACRTRSDWQVFQWMSEYPSEEAALLRIFAEYARRFKTCIHFNGSRFDIPYLEEKYEQYGFPSPFSALSSVDMYRDLRQLKTFLSLKQMNQKSIEQFIGLTREDRFDGGELIRVYHDFCKSRSEAKKELLLLHNREDVTGMLQLQAMYAYLQFLEETLPDISPAFNGRVIEVQPVSQQEELHSCISTAYAIQLAWKLPSPVPRAITRTVDGYTLRLCENRVSVDIPVLHGKMKFFFENYRDYYYLPEEDRAIHKSVALFVDKEYRIRATRETCYTYKSGDFIPQPADLFTPAFRMNAADSFSCFLPDPSFFDDQDRLHRYAAAILSVFYSSSGYSPGRPEEHRRTSTKNSEAG